MSAPENSAPLSTVPIHHCWPPGSEASKNAINDSHVPFKSLVKGRLAQNNGLKSCLLISSYQLNNALYDQRLPRSETTPNRFIASTEHKNTRNGAFACNDSVAIPVSLDEHKKRSLSACNDGVAIPVSLEFVVYFAITYYYTPCNSYTLFIKRRIYVFLNLIQQK